MRRTMLYLLLIFLPVPVFAGGILQFRMIKLPQAVGDAIMNNAIADSHGLLWFYNTSGLHRYDGNHLITFDLVSNPSVIFNAITCLVLDKNDNVWIGTQNGLVFFDTHAWTTREIRPAGNSGDNGRQFIKRICIGQDGTVYTIGNQYKIYRVENGTLVQVADLAGEPRADPYAVAIAYIGEPVKNQLWIVRNGRLQWLQKNGNTYTLKEYFPMPELKGSITSEVYFHPSGKIIFWAGQAGFWVFDPRRRQLTPMAPQSDLGQTFSGFPKFFTLPDGAPGIYMRRLGIFRYDADHNRLLVPPHNIPGSFFDVDVTYTDTRNNKIYYSCDKGIAELQLTPGPFTNLLVTASDAPAQSIRAIFKLSDTCLLTTSYKEGFIQLNEVTGSVTSISDKPVYRVLPWNNHRLLLATEGDALYWYTPTDHKMTPVKAVIPASEGQPARTPQFITSLCRENDSMVWVGSYRGAFLLNVHTGIMIPPGKGKALAELQYSKVNDILTSTGHCYFASVKGLFDLNRSNGEIRQLPVSTDTATTWYCICRANGELWLGSNGRGIQVADADGKLIREINSSNGLAGNIVYTLVQQDHWIVAGTDHGLSIIDTRNNHVSSYSRLDNLPSNEFNHASAAQYGNRIYLGTLNGITAFNIEALMRYEQADMQIPLCLTNFSTTSKMALTHHYNLPYLQPLKLKVPPGVDFFSLSFGAVDKRADLLNYYYRINDNAPWLEIGQQHDINIARISPGNYTFRLATRFPGQTAFKELLSVPLEVLPAFYETWWFRLLCLAAVIVLVMAIFRYRMKQLLKEQYLRTKIAGDLHDEVGSTLTRICFHADRLSAAPEAPLMAKQIAGYSREALGTMSDMVWSIDSRFDTAADLVSRMKDFVSKLGNELEIHFSFPITGSYSNMPLAQIIRQNYFLIFKEAVNNATRYAASPEIEIRLQFTQQIILQVSNVCNTAEAGARKHHQGGQGTFFMQQRAQHMKGRLEIRQEGNRYTLELTVPLR